jgi:hypothetical protein
MLFFEFGQCFVCLLFLGRKSEKRPHIENVRLFDVVIIKLKKLGGDQQYKSTHHTELSSYPSNRNSAAGIVTGYELDYQGLEFESRKVQ